MAVITILATLVLPVVTKSIGQGETTKCVTQMRQIGQAYAAYVAALDQWMPCAGNLAFQHDYGPTNWTVPAPPYDNSAFPNNALFESPWFRANWSGSTSFQYWYQAMQPYMNPTANAEYARKSYYEREQKEMDPADMQAMREEQGRLLGIASCPSKRNSPIGYGYNYTAPYGNSACYPNASFNYKWIRDNNDTVGRPTPIDSMGYMTPIPILWYELYVHFGAISEPSNQISFCDTGFVNSATFLNLDPRAWIEITDISDPNNTNSQGYVRFPLIKRYWPNNAANNNKGRFSRAYEVRPWRPVPRHGGRTVCLFFDGSVKALPISDVVSPTYQWGDPPCLYDNRAPHRPPVSPLRWITTPMTP